MSGQDASLDPELVHAYCDVLSRHARARPCERSCRTGDGGGRERLAEDRLLAAMGRRP